jgi:hypothetical protein
VDRPKLLPLCGSGILHTLKMRGPEYVVIKAGTLDEPNVVTPQYEIFVRSKLPWVSIAGETMKLMKWGRNSARLNTIAVTQAAQLEAEAYSITQAAMCNAKTT